MNWIKKEIAAQTMYKIYKYKYDCQHLFPVNKHVFVSRRLEQFDSKKSYLIATIITILNPKQE
jgi:hypothetical protein